MTVPRVDIRLIALDIDGTLLRSDRTLSPRVIDAVRRAARSVPVLLATARPPRSTGAIHAALALETSQVNYNGALVWHRPAERVEFHAPLDARLAGELIAAARALVPTATVNIERLDRSYTDRVDPRFVTETGRLFPPDVVAPLESFADIAPTKLMVHADAEDVTLLRARLEPAYAGRVAFIRTDPDLLQMMNAGVSKWRTITRVADALGIGMAHIMAIGDNENDIEMIRGAGLGVAMGNGTADARGAARWTAPTNDADGVAVAIETHFA